MKQKAKTVAADISREYVHLAGVTNVLHSLQTGDSQTGFVRPEISVEQNRERHP